MKVATPAKPDTALNTTAARKDATPMTTAALAKVPGPAMTPPSPGTNTPAEAKTDAKTAAPATSAAAASKAATGDAGPLSGVFSLTLNDGVRAYEARNFAAAYDIWLQLAEQGDARAQFHLGALYFEGRGVARDFGKAREWLGRASKSGDGRAAMMLKRVNAAAAASAGT
jgi:TPR repeat protein